MNDLINLRGRIYSEPYRPPDSIGARLLNKSQSYNIRKIEKLKSDLNEVIDYWNKHHDYLNNTFITVEYEDIVPKSRRLHLLLSRNKSSLTHETVVGAKFSNTRKKRHIITHYLPLNYVKRTIKTLEQAQYLIVNYLDTDVINREISENLKENLYDINYENTQLTKTSFMSALVDIANAKTFYVDLHDIEDSHSNIVTIYKTEKETSEILNELGIKVTKDRFLDDLTVLLSPDDVQKLFTKASYLVAMSLTNISKIETIETNEYIRSSVQNLPTPSDEPTIGVIDTHFDERVYFGDWVEYHNMIDDEIPLSSRDYEHGTAVSSIIVDGPSSNPELEDGCGRFKVRHFGVTADDKFNSFSITKMIKEIVESNRDITVWNLSLGSNVGINKSYVSPEASILDDLQAKYNVIFVVSGTNNKKHKESQFIGSPADSINSLVVNSVDENNVIADYTRHGPVLSFYYKPDVCYYGGTTGKFMRVCKPLGEDKVAGTSFATPWVSGKLSFLIDKMGLPREIAKALIVDSAQSPPNDVHDYKTYGYGIVPVKIEDILYGNTDEIKFFIYNEVKDFENFAHNIPVPHDNKVGKYPYFAKATLAYFPTCSKNQGVDYADTELSIKFGRIDNSAKIKDIKSNNQYEEGSFINEEEARHEYRKWDNTKVVREKITKRNGLKIYDPDKWGFSVIATDRFNDSSNNGLNYGIVFTLKEINGKNRIDTFIKECQINGWIVNKINIENQIEIHNTAEEEIEFD